MTRRRMLALGASAASLGAIGTVRAGQRRAVLVELFTSQACAACPPADAFLAELREIHGVVALTYHIDYWDYLGWRDTLASPIFSRRQYDYAHARNDMDVYTPQMIVDGGRQYVGNKREPVLAAIERAREAPAGVAVGLSERGEDFVVEIGDTDRNRDATAWIVPIVPQTTVKILKGEIAGTEVSYHNVVRDLIALGSWTGTAKTFTIKRAAVVAPCCKGCIVVVQQGKVGPVLGVATWGEIGA